MDFPFGLLCPNPNGIRKLDKTPALTITNSAHAILGPVSTFNASIMGVVFWNILSLMFVIEPYGVYTLGIRAIFWHILRLLLGLRPFRVLHLFFEDYACTWALCWELHPSNLSTVCQDGKMSCCHTAFWIGLFREHSWAIIGKAKRAHPTPCNGALWNSANSYPFYFYPWIMTWDPAEFGPA